ncbi:MAG TPA: AMP-binding protein [Methylomirabilota bacterium]|nr:AMP-binding protein [Methylomirabilota bacterium]
MEREECRNSRPDPPADPPASRTLPDLLEELAARQPDREFVVGGGQRLSYAQTRDGARRLARGLRRLGVARGDRVALVMTNRPEWVLIDFAVMSLGATLVPISTWSRPRELEYVLAHCGVGTLVTIPRLGPQRFLDAVGEMGGPDSPRLPDLRHLVVAGAAHSAGAITLDDLGELGRDVPDAEMDAARRAVGPEDVACILYTSGTTSNPKGVPLRHGGLIANMWNIGERQRLTPADRMWMGISLFWSFGCANALVAVMSHGGTLVLQEQLDAGEALALIERERCTVYYGTPNIALALTEHPDRPRRDLSSLRTGAAIGPPAAIQMVMDLGAREICNVYGLTECYGNCTVTDAHDPPEVRRTTVGHPLPGMEIRVVDRESRRPLPPGEIGEILVRGHLTPGYYRDPEKNAAAFDRDGFLLTGDLGFLGEDGRLRFRGRIKEMVKTGGINVAPVEVEEVLLGHPTVEQAYVVGVPDPRKEEILVAVVVPKPGREADPAALRALCRDALAAYKVPAEIRVMAREDLPVTSTGKVQKLRLAEILARL